MTGIENKKDPSNLNHLSKWTSLTPAEVQEQDAKRKINRDTIALKEIKDNPNISAEDYQKVIKLNISPGQQLSLLKIMIANGYTYDEFNKELLSKKGIGLAQIPRGK